MRREMYKFKAAIIITLINLFIIPSVFAQSPDKISYQAVIRNSSNQLVTDQAIGMKISILQNSESGTPIYVETQAPTSNANGLISIKIGGGTVVTGIFTDIDWANNTYFIKTEIDIAGGTNYTITGTSQLLSVPYALHAKTAESLTGTYLDQFINIFENNGMTVVDFSVPYTHVLMGNEFGFTDLSEINATTWHWDFGDGNTSTEQNPTHTYQTEGVFTVSLTAGNGTISVTKTKVDYMTVTDGPVYDSFTDSRDGTVYQSVTIGDQVWMAENLKFIEYVSPPSTYNIIFPVSYVYGYSGSDVAEAKATVNYNTYGVLYNRAAATSYSLCPSGWHLPTDAEWSQLANYFVDITIEGGKLKEAGTVHWNSPNTGATNETGFTALPGGLRDESSTFGNLKQVGHWWSATEDDPDYENYGLTWELRYDSSSLKRSAHFYSVGLSVRCVRD
ncbi:MAG: FISUMP domain-containing protein [Bacteroidales bacterium]|nr:FISUMP domain-containing protein [Bacteroidales bacterium]